MSTKPRNEVRPQAECLEEREVLAPAFAVGGMRATYQGPILTIKGTPHNDRVLVEQRGNRLFVSGTRMRRPADRTREIVIWGGSGEDLLRNRTAIRSRLYGQDDNDKLFGGSGNDVLKGGSNNDRLLGLEGRDKLWGQGGNDYLDGGPDFDPILRGGSGEDTWMRVLGAAQSGFSMTDQDMQNDETYEEAGEFGRTGSWLAGNPRADHFLDINQQMTPTCSFLASLAATAQTTGPHDDLVDRIHRNGSLYGVPLFVDGTWQTYWVTGIWNEVHDPDGELWVTLYQHAFLQAMGVMYLYKDGSYRPEQRWYSSRGNSWQIGTNTLTTVTGRPAYWVWMASMDPATMASELARGWALTASSLQKPPSAAITPSHAYMVHTLNRTSLGQYDVVLYNPHHHDGPLPSCDGVDEGLVTISWANFESNFAGYAKA